MSINGVVQATYKYNALGQQVHRDLTQAGQTLHSVHDLEGNRIAEYLYDDMTQTSSLLREYVWLDGVVIENDTVFQLKGSALVEIVCFQAYQIITPSNATSTALPNKKYIQISSTQLPAIVII